VCTTFLIASRTTRGGKQLNAPHMHLVADATGAWCKTNFTRCKSVTGGAGKTDRLSAFSWALPGAVFYKRYCIELDINAERRMHVLSGSPPFQCFAKKDNRITLVPRSRVMHPQYQVLFENLHLTCLLIMLIINVNYITLKKYRIKNESKDSDYNHNSNYLN